MGASVSLNFRNLNLQSPEPKCFRALFPQMRSPCCLYPSILVLSLYNLPNPSVFELQFLESLSILALAAKLHPLLRALSPSFRPMPPEPNCFIDSTNSPNSLRTFTLLTDSDAPNNRRNDHAHVFTNDRDTRVRLGGSASWNARFLSKSSIDQGSCDGRPHNSTSRMRAFNWASREVGQVEDLRPLPDWIAILSQNP